VDKEKLITKLQQTQEANGYLSMEALKGIADELKLTLAKVLGVATFYAQFRLKPVGKNLILLCQGTACHVNGSAQIEQYIKEYIGVCEDEISEDGLFTYSNVACLGCCSLAPAMMIADKIYGGLDKEKVVAILDGIKEAAQ